MMSSSSFRPLLLLLLLLLFRPPLLLLLLLLPPPLLLLLLLLSVGKSIPRSAPIRQGQNEEAKGCFRTHQITLNLKATLQSWPLGYLYKYEK